MEEYYFQIAKFNIVIKFYPASWDQIRKLIQKQILYYLKAFVLKKKPKKIDLILEFKENYQYRYIKDRLGKKTFFDIYQTTHKNTYLFYYTISIFQFQMALKMILNQLLLAGNGVILHAAANQVGEFAYIYVGKSGSGKTTVIELLKHIYTPLADDNAIVRLINSRLFFFSSPFWEKQYDFKRDRQPHPIKIFFVKKSIKNLIRPIVNKKTILSYLIKQVIFVDKNKEENKKQLSQVIKITQAINTAFFLDFNRNKKELQRIIEKTK